MARGSCLEAMGCRLRQAREARGLAAAALADRLRIGVEQLEALESADRQRLPEPVFVIAQARRIAEALQLDITEELLALRASGELQPRSGPVSGDSARAGPVGRAVASPGPGVPPTEMHTHWLRPAGVRLLAVGGVLLLALLAVWGAWRQRGGGSLPDGLPPPAPIAAPAGRPGA